MTTATTADTEEVKAQAQKALSTETTPQETVAETVTVTAAELATLRANAVEVADLKHKLSSFEGSARGRQKLEDRLTGLERNLNKQSVLLEAYLESDGDFEAAKAKRATLTEQERQGLSQQRFAARANTLGSWMETKRKALDLPLTNPIVLAFKERWDRVPDGDTDGLNDLAREWGDFVTTEMEKRTEGKVKEATEKALKEANDKATERLRKAGVLGENSPKGAPASSGAGTETYEELSQTDTRGWGQGKLAEHKRKLDAARVALR